MDGIEATLIELRTKVDVRTNLLRLSVGLNTSLIGGIIIYVFVK